MTKRILFCAASLLCLLTFAFDAAPAVFIVNNTLDVGPGSLRQEIINANITPGPDTITFNIGGGGFQTIMPLSQLPPLTDPQGVWIDGFSQPGGAGPGALPPMTATLLIEINGIAAGPSHGLWIQSDMNTINGLIVNDFEQDGIRIEGGLANPTANMNLLFCNFVGTDQSGTLDRGNGRNMNFFWGGVHICNVPEGTARDNAVDASLISGNWAEGVWIEGPRQPGLVGYNFVTGSFIGTDINGTADLGNDHEGVAMTEGTVHNEVIFNLISGNDYDGVGMQGYNNYGYPAPPIQTSYNLVLQNIIGLDYYLNPLPNTMHGVAIGEYGPGQWGCADFNEVIDNVIAYNGTDGVAVYEDWINNFNADHNRISENAIYKNGGLGIDLENDGVTLNDVTDGDTGANQQLNFPAITSVVYAASVTTISGTLGIDTPPDLATVEIFLAETDPLGHGEGKLWLGSTMPTPAGNWSFVTNMLSPGDFITATATDMNNNTSEFCLNAVVPGAMTFWSQRRTISERVFSQINLSLSAGPAYANRGYVIVGSLSGVSPGTWLPKGLAHLPLNWDWFTKFVLTYGNTPIFSNFKGFFDALGNSSAQINAPAMPPGSAGLVMHFAYCTYTPYDFASDALGIQVAWY